MDEWNAAFAALAGTVKVYSRSYQTTQQAIWFLIRSSEERLLVVCGVPEVFEGLEGETISCGPKKLGIFPLTAPHAQVLRKHFAWLNPRPYGLEPTFGCGDRLGLATPGHIRAARACGVRVLLAQQSIREMARTQRTPQQVMDDALWGAFQEGFTEGFGSDADHLKTFQDIESTASVGFTMFTIDPSEYVDREADNASESSLDQKISSLHTPELPVPTEELLKRYAGKSFHLPNDQKIIPTLLEIKRALVKYGRAVAHTERMATHIKRMLAGRPFDLEMSVDETDNPTTPVEHLFVGQELKRRGVIVQSLALRFIGEFQKGVDYIGDIREFESAFALQFAIAKLCGPYKMSIHSGSDKFTIFPIIGKIAGRLVHEKTAGTSYLEALHVVSRVDPAFFRDICLFARNRFPVDRATYHVVEKLDDLPPIDQLKDSELESLFENNDARQMLHVTFGSVLNEVSSDGKLRFKTRFLQVLRDHEDLHAELLEHHFSRHMRALKMAER